MTQDNPSIEKTDVLVVGGGPVGCLVSLQLNRFKCSTVTVEKEDKPSIPIYGRATTLWCRTLELLDQLDLCQDLMDDGILTRGGINYRNGVAAPGGMPFGQKMFKHGDSRFNFSLHLRQRLIERAFERALEEYDASPRHRHELIGFTVAPDEEGKEYPVEAKIRDNKSNREYIVLAKAIVGADGAHSPVRKGAGIPFIGERSANKWIRIDALVETNMPSPRTLNSVQSESHGLVLWCPIDEGKIRIGYVFNAELQKKYGENGITGEVVMEEAKKAMAPFSLEFKTLDWFTCYGIGQCMAESFVKGRVMLAGDSCHTHSSGSAQGLNTGVLDATNLAWKLALFLRGIGTRDLLQSYNDERYLGVNQVIENDKVISTLISGHLPPKFKDRKEHPRDILDEWFNNAETISFTIGLGVKYPQNNLINDSPVQAPLSTVLPGERGPEAFVTRLGTNELVPLQKLLPNVGSFYVVIFTGIPHLNHTSLSMIRDHFDAPNNLLERFGKNVIKTFTIVGAGGVAANEILGMRSFGRSYYDANLEAHQRYGVSPIAGALVVFRPDGYIGKVAPLGSPDSLVEYFSRFLVPKKGQLKAITNGVNGAEKAKRPELDTEA